MIRGCLVLLAIGSAARAQEAAATVPSGVPLRVVLDRRVPVRTVGQPVQGRLVEAVYVYDRMVVPASVVEGHIAAIGGVPAGRRFRAILNGNFTPRRDATVQFDTLVLPGGARVPLKTSSSPGTAHVVVAGKPGKKPQSGLPALRAPGRMSRLKDALLDRLPYRRQAWASGTHFTGVLQDSLTIPLSSPAEPEAGAADQPVLARLLTPIGSTDAQRGTPVEAVVTRPVFSADRRLLIPEGSRLRGDVVEAKRARWLHRNGKVLFVFRQIQFPSGTVQEIQGYLESVQTGFSANLSIDSEGAARVTSPKSRFIFPALAVTGAGLSIHQDYNSQGVPDQDIAGRAESGAIGLGLIGTVLAQTSRTLASGMAFTGAAFSVYSTFVARGQEVVLPLNTPLEVSLRTRGGETVAH